MAPREDGNLQEDALLQRETLRSVAEEAHRAECPPNRAWPDCHDVATAIRDRLVDEWDVPDDRLRVREYQPVGGFRHYALVLDALVLGETAVVDASFGQFAAETETPIDIAPHEEIDDVAIVAPKERYVFVGV